MKKTQFLQEVDTQPEVLAKLADYYDGDGASLLNSWRKLLESHNNIQFVGMGTSEIAPLLIRDSLAAAGISYCISDAGEYVHYQSQNPRSDTVHVLISQSGESAETKKATLALSGGGVPTVAVVNDESSTMAREADLALPIRAGDEKSISNKTYLNTLAVLHLMAGGDTDSLRKTADAMGSHFDEAEIERAAEHLLPGDSIHFIARGPALCTANQLALTFMEGAQAHGRAFTGGAFRHGPYEVLGSSHRVVVIAPGGRTSQLSLSMAAEMANAGSHVVLVTDIDGVESRENVVQLKVHNPCGEHMFPLAFARTQAWLLSHVARLRGHEAGVFKRVSKVTEVE